MTTETIRFRSMKQAQATADERGLRPDQFGILKLGTAKYELTITIAEEPASVVYGQEMQNAAALATAAVVSLSEKSDEQPAKKERAARPTRVNRHWNDDGSLTLYVGGVKLRRIGGEENEEASEEEIEDPEAAAEKILGRRFLKRDGGWTWGRTTQGHNWHTKRARRLREQIAARREAGEDVSDLEAQLARLTTRGA